MKAHSKHLSARRSTRRQPVASGVRPTAPAPAEAGWDHVASWYDALVGDEGSDYHRNVIIPAALRLLAPRTGEKVLDLCCGQGVLIRHLLAAGAGEVMGVDASANLIELAQRRYSTEQAQGRVSFLVADAMKSLPALKEVFDCALCVMAIQDLSDPAAACRSMSQALRTGGRAVIVMMHPCFRIPRQSSWGWDDARKMQYRRIDRYANNLDIPIATHPGRNQAVSTLFHHRPLSTYLNALGSVGLAVVGCEELCTHRRSQPGGRSKGENRAWQEFPLFLALKTLRISASQPSLRS